MGNPDDNAPGWWAAWQPPGHDYILSATTIRGNEVVIVTNSAVWHGRVTFGGPEFRLIAQI